MVQRMKIPRILEIGNRRIGKGNPAFIIAEIGTAHQGKIERAREFIRVSRDAGADCVKFQAVFADEILHPEAGFIELPGGRVDLYERFRSLEQEESFYAECKREAEAKGLVFLCSAFGLRSARMLKSMGVKAIKIASPESNHYPLLDEVSGYGLPVIASTGVTTCCDIERMLSVLGTNTALLHCITSYPAPEEEYNIRLIPNLRRIFGVITGVSDHSLDPILVPVLTVAVGGSIIEKHLALSKSDGGLDDTIALDPNEFETMVKQVRIAEKRNREHTIALVKEAFGEKRICAILGSGIKRMPGSEIHNYLTTKRSICALTDIEEGEPYTEKNTALLRSEKNLRPGLRPEFHHIILNKPAKKRIKAGYGITWDDVI